MFNGEKAPQTVSKHYVLFRSHQNVRFILMKCAGFRLIRGHTEGKEYSYVNCVI